MTDCWVWRRPGKGPVVARTVTVTFLTAYVEGATTRVARSPAYCSIV